MSEPTAREVAARFLLRIEDGSHADELNRESGFLRLSTQDRKLAKRLVYGVLRSRGRLDFFASRLSKRPLAKLDREVLSILRCALYQLDALRLPDHAAVHSSVELCRRLGVSSAAPYVNALLRRFLRSKPPLPQAHDSESLSVVYSHPGWLVRRYLRRYGLVEACQLMRRNNSEPMSALWVNPFKSQFSGFLSLLVEAGIEHEVYPELENCLIVEPSFSRHELYQKGHCFFMDAASQEVTAGAPLDEVSRIADVCAAPGGKSFLLAARVRPKGRLFCTDSSRVRLMEMRLRSQLYGVPGLQFAVADWAQAVPVRCNFDLVLVDAPCSGLGTLRSRPDIRWKIREGDLQRHCSRQAAILENAFSTVRSGGELIYSTCSTEPEENEDIVAGFLKEHPKARLVECKATYPQDHPGDCFYWVRIRQD